MTNYYDKIELSLTETVEAIQEAKRKKFFHIRNAWYWEKEQEKASLAHEEEKRLNRMKSAQLKSLNIGSPHPSENAQHVKQPKN